jgi:hypothetical protein
VIEARLHLPRRGFTLDVDLLLPESGVTVLFGAVRLRQDHGAARAGRAGTRDKAASPSAARSGRTTHAACSCPRTGGRWAT